MSLTHPDFSTAPAPEERLRTLRADGATVALDSVAGGVVLHTGFGFGPEFWLMARDSFPPEPAWDFDRWRVCEARLILDGAAPVTARAPIRAAGARIYALIPSFSTALGGPPDA